MHAAFPNIPNEMQQILKSASASSEDFISRLTGNMLANVMSQLLDKGIAFLFRPSFLDFDQKQTKRAEALFEDVFVTNDRGIKGFYQGQFLIRTKKQGDDMNLWFRFCPDPSNLYQKTAWGFFGNNKVLNPWAVVETKTLTEEEADRLEKNPDKVDLVIRFKDSEAILGLVGQKDADMVGLLLKNVVQLSGNVGHLFKLGAVAAEIQRAFEHAKQEDE
jgi:hypothetical protein